MSILSVRVSGAISVRVRRSLALVAVVADPDPFLADVRQIGIFGTQVFISFEVGAELRLLFFSFQIGPSPKEKRPDGESRRKIPFWCIIPYLPDQYKNGSGTFFMVMPAPAL